MLAPYMGIDDSVAYITTKFTVTAQLVALDWSLNLRGEVGPARKIYKVIIYGGIESRPCFRWSDGVDQNARQAFSNIELVNLRVKLGCLKFDTTADLDPIPVGASLMTIIQ